MRFPGRNMNKKFRESNLLIRTLSAVVLTAVFLVFGILGGYFWFGLVSLIALLGLYEFYKLFGIEKEAEGIAGYLIAACYLAAEAFQADRFLLTILVFGFILLMGVYVFRFAHSDSVKAIASYFGIVYTAVLLSFMYRIRILPDGAYLVWLIFAASWGTDLFAYFTGILFGKHKMAPVLSPKKSVEGAVGGVIGAGLLGALFGLLFGRYFKELQHPIAACAVLTASAGLISMIGDLTASAFKRNHNIKDYSNLIPGHGGILDRFDSVIFVSPIIYYVALFFMR